MGWGRARRAGTSNVTAEMISLGTVRGLLQLASAAAAVGPAHPRHTVLCGRPEHRRPRPRHGGWASARLPQPEGSGERWEEQGSGEWGSGRWPG